MKSFLLASTALLAVPAAAQTAPTAPATTAQAQPAPAPASEEEESEEGEITVTGQRPRGSVVGNIPAENVLDSRDIRATGATSISELLDSVAAQTGSARGRSSGPPVVLLNGQRISGFRELRDLPPEAIQRMEILPEEVALKYGYSADQRVVNIVLRRRFNSTNVEVGGQVATDGGYASGRANVGRLTIRDDTRTSGNIRINGNNPLYETERDISARVGEPIDSRPFRTLVGAQQAVNLSGTISRPISKVFTGTLTGEASRTRGTSALGLLSTDPIRRTTTSNTLGFGASVNGQKDKWRLSGTANVDYAESNSDTPVRLDESRSRRGTISLDGTATGPLMTLPAGTSNITVKAGVSALSIDSRSQRAGTPVRSKFDRQIAEGSASVDLPLTERASKIGRLTANLNGGIDQLSDFGTLTSLGAGLNWSPDPKLNFLASFTREEGAPSLQQLGDPFLETTGVPFFDAVRGQTVSVTTVTGGNPALDADRRNVFKIGGNYRLSDEPGLNLRAEFVHERVDRPQISFPAATAALEAAFPSRFIRDGSGQLLSVDLRPVNADYSRRDTLRWGFDFNKQLKTKRPSAETINRLVQQARQRFGNQFPVPGAQPGTGTAPAATPTPTPAAPGGDSPPPPPPADGAAPPPPGGPGGGGFRFGGGGRGGGGGGPFGAGGRGGRLNLSATHTVTFNDELIIGPGLPKLDYLSGEAAGANGGRPRHQVQVEGGYYNNGIGLRAEANWRSATRVASAGDNLRFGSYADLDLRLFANLGERLDLVTKAPFFRGSTVRFEINNVFNARPKVRGGSGGVIPFAYQPDRLEPIGRTVGITFRKLFVPTRFIRSVIQEGQQGRRPN
ncbi:hypothetical protein GCM10022281_07590 [Sphingomonas rosea]|uniref:TonB-dependent receptor plug domain-containing protein n=1 Tax=Sphingomonas rosea TaxID=335605 RepID=A0ABP7TT77_9SPHN